MFSRAGCTINTWPGCVGRSFEEPRKKEREETRVVDWECELANVQKNVDSKKKILDQSKDQITSCIVSIKS